jgi:hypothetical protein
LTPTIRAYVIGPHDTDIDLFYTLPNAIGAKWHFERAYVQRPTCAIELLPDVHRDHGVRNAILVVAPARGIDRYLRLAIANAWREGVRRFILLFAAKARPSGAAVDELEQELRVLLDSLGDGGAAPCIRASLTRSAGRVEGEMRETMEQLVAEIERVFPAGDAPVVDEPLPASFDREVELLEIVRPLIRPGTLVERSRDVTFAADPFAPACRTCMRLTTELFRVDARDALHPPPPAHRVFVTYSCKNCYSSDLHVEHGEPPHEPVMKAERLCYMLPDGEWLSSTHPDVAAQLAAIDNEMETLYYCVQDALGMGSVCIPDHLGGWALGWRPNERCPTCDDEVVLVASLQYGDGWHDLWACPAHPDFARCNYHK